MTHVLFNFDAADVVAYLSLRITFRTRRYRHLCTKSGPRDCTAKAFPLGTPQAQVLNVKHYIHDCSFGILVPLPFLVQTLLPLNDLFVLPL